MGGTDDGWANLEEAELVGSLVRAYDESLDIAHIAISEGDSQGWERERRWSAGDPPVIINTGTHTKVRVLLKVADLLIGPGKDAVSQSANPDSVSCQSKLAERRGRG